MNDSMMASIPIFRGLECVRCHRNIMEGGGPWMGQFHSNWDPAGVVCVDCWYNEVQPKLQDEWELAWLELQRELEESRG